MTREEQIVALEVARNAVDLVESLMRDLDAIEEMGGPYSFGGYSRSVEVVAALKQNRDVLNQTIREPARLLLTSKGKAHTVI